jgi:hypothetical protein
VILAHGLGGRTDLPLPTWMVAYGGAAVLLVSFAALRAWWPRPRWDGAELGLTLGHTSDRFPRVALIVARAAGLAALAVVVIAAVGGEDNPALNIAPTAIYIVVWVGFAFVSALVGDLWRVVNPFDTLSAAGRWLFPRTAHRAGPNLGYWPAAVGLTGFVWLELVHPDRAQPRTIAPLLVGYTVVAVAAGIVWGRDWLYRSEAFSAFFGILAHCAPIGRDSQGRLRLRPPFAGLATLPPTPGLDAIVLVVLGSTSFDGLTRTQFWLNLTAGRAAAALMLMGTAGLAAMIVAVAMIYLAAIRVTARITDARVAETSLAFAPSLVPIAFAYTVAHYFSLLVLEGQDTIALLSDPFGRGWDLFGTVDQRINYTLLSPTAIGWVQAGAIVAGHVAAVIVAHDRALARCKTSNAVRAQYPLLGAMVVFTMGGLFLLLSG